MIFFTNFTVPDGFAGCARGPFIFIRPSHRDDVGLIAHEKVHRWQWIRTFGLHSFCYLLSESYRLKAELEAYSEQLRHAPSSLSIFAHYISTKYNVTITAEEAAEMLGDRAN